MIKFLILSLSIDINESCWFPWKLLYLLDILLSCIYIIKLTQHIGFLTLVGMERLVEGNHGIDSKRG